MPSLKDAKINRGQIWKSKTTGIVLKIMSKHGGNRHWSATQLNGKHSHHIHEGTLHKYYELING
jgi:hypothetical protein